MHLETAFYTEEGAVKAVDDVSFTIHEEETVCIVGSLATGKAWRHCPLCALFPRRGESNGERCIFPDGTCWN